MSHRENNIDALRLILALLVIASHSFPTATGTEEREPLAVFSAGQMTFGRLAVDSFFILSGYLISQSWERSRSAGSFLKKRVFRIYPGYLTAVAVCVWVVVPLFSPTGMEVFSWSSLANNLPLMLRLNGFSVPPTFVHNPAPFAVNGSLWSIPYEFWCYIGVMVLGVTTLFHRRRFLAIMLPALVAVHFFFEYTDCTRGGGILGTIFGYPRFWVRLLPVYLSGVLAYQFRDSIRLNRIGALLCLIGFFVAAKIPYGLIAAMPTCGTYVLMYLAFTDDWKWRSAARYGDFSYGIYLYAFPIQQSIMHIIGQKIEPFQLFLLATPPAVLAGIMSWYLVERWFQQKKPRNAGATAIIEPAAVAN